MNKWTELRLVRKAKRELRLDYISNLWCQAAQLSDDDSASLYFDRDEEEWAIERSDSINCGDANSIVVVDKKSWSAVDWLKGYLAGLQYQEVYEWFRWAGADVDPLEPPDAEDEQTFHDWLESQMECALLFNNTGDAILETFVDVEQNLLEAEREKVIKLLDETECGLVS